MSKPILFYSKKSSECINLWKILTEKNMLNDFVKICVDNNNKIPGMVNTVPAIFIKGRPIIYGPGINMFLSNSSVSNNTPQSSKPNFQSSPNQSSPQEKQPQVQTSTNNLGGILDFNAVEMGNSFSDSYSFIQENPSPMDFCYQFIQNEKDNIITGSNNSTNNVSNSANNVSNSNRSSGLDQRLNELQKQRNNF